MSSPMFKITRIMEKNKDLSLSGLEKVLRRVIFDKPENFQQIREDLWDLTGPVLERLARNADDEQENYRFLQMLGSYGLLKDFPEYVEEFEDEDDWSEIHETGVQVIVASPILKYVITNENDIFEDSAVENLKVILEPYLDSEETYWTRAICKKYMEMIEQIPLSNRDAQREREKLIRDLRRACRNAPNDIVSEVQLLPFPVISRGLSKYAGGTWDLYRVYQPYLAKRHENECVRVFTYGEQAFPFTVTEDEQLQVHHDTVNFVRDCVARGKRFVILSLTLPGHANMLIYDALKETVELFEPHGMGTSDELHESMNQQIEQWWRDNFNIKHYYAPLDYCPLKGIQSWMRLTRDMGSTEDHDSYQGFCVVFSMWYADLRLTYPNVPPRELVRRITDLFAEEVAKNTAKQMYTYVSGFVAFIMEFSKLSEEEQLQALQQYQNMISSAEKTIIPTLLQAEALTTLSDDDIIEELRIQPNVMSFLKVLEDKSDVEFLNIITKPDDGIPYMGRAYQIRMENVDPFEGSLIEALSPKARRFLLHRIAHKVEDHHLPRLQKLPEWAEVVQKRKKSTVQPHRVRRKIFR